MTRSQCQGSPTSQDNGYHSAANDMKASYVESTYTVAKTYGRNAISHRFCFLLPVF